jgi:hypothetical protein
LTFPPGTNKLKKDVTDPALISPSQSLSLLVQKAGVDSLSASLTHNLFICLRVISI